MSAFLTDSVYWPPGSSMMLSTVAAAARPGAGAASSAEPGRVPGSGVSCCSTGVERTAQHALALHGLHRPDHALAHRRNLDVKEHAVAVEDEAPRARLTGQDGHRRIDRLHPASNLLRSETGGF